MHAVVTSHPRFGGAMSPNPAPPPAALVFVFDDRLGTHERDEHAKLLGVFPSTTSSDDCCAAVGLAQGVIAFLAPFVDEISVAELQSVAEGKGGTTGTKQNTKPHAKHPKQTQARSACLTGSSRRLVCYEPEPHVWWVVSLDVGVFFPEPRAADAAVRALLKQTHLEFTFLHGPVEALLATSTANAFRAKLAPVVASLGNRLTPTGDEYSNEKGIRTHSRSSGGGRPVPNSVTRWRFTHGPGSLHRQLRVDGLTSGVSDVVTVFFGFSNGHEPKTGEAGGDAGGDAERELKALLAEIAKTARAKTGASCAIYFPSLDGCGDVAGVTDKKGAKITVTRRTRVVLGDPLDGESDAELDAERFVTYCLRCFSPDLCRDDADAETNESARLAREFASATREEAKGALRTMRKWGNTAERTSESDTTGSNTTESITTESNTTKSNTTESGTTESITTESSLEIDRTPFMAGEAVHEKSVTVGNDTHEIVPLRFVGGERNGGGKDVMLLVFLAKKNKSDGNVETFAETLGKVIDSIMTGKIAAVHSDFAAAALTDDCGIETEMPFKIESSAPFLMRTTGGTAGSTYGGTGRSTTGITLRTTRASSVDAVTRNVAADTLVSVADLATELDRLASAFGNDTETSTRELPTETCHRSRHDAWVATKVTNGNKKVTCVVQGGNLTLLEAANAAEAFRVEHGV